MKLLLGYLSRNQFVAALVIIALTWFFVSIREILVVLFISFILMTALIPIANFLKKKGISHSISVMITYLTFIAFFLLLILPLAPFFIHQIGLLTNNFPQLFESATKALGIKIDYSNITSSLSNFFQAVGGNIISISGKILEDFFRFLQ